MFFADHAKNVRIFYRRMQAVEKRSVFFYIPATNISYGVWQIFSAVLFICFYSPANSFCSVYVYVSCYVCAEAIDSYQFTANQLMIGTQTAELLWTQ